MLFFFLKEISRCKYSVLFVLILTIHCSGVMAKQFHLLHQNGDVINETNNYIYPKQAVNSFEINKNQQPYNMNINLSVFKREREVVATLSLNNKSNIDYYINKYQLPSSSKNPLWGPLCSQSFLITSEDIQVNYLGKECQIDEEQDGWVKIPAQQSKKYFVHLNNAYEFLSGNNFYYIETVGYLVVNAQWISMNFMYDKMFSIYNWKYDCQCTGNYHFLDCANDFFKDLLQGIGFDGGMSQYAFVMKSNRVGFEVKLSDINSYYFLQQTIMNEINSQ